MVQRKHIYKYGRYMAALLLLSAVAFLAVTARQLSAPAKSPSRHGILGPAGMSSFNSFATGSSQGTKANGGPVGPIVQSALKSDTSAALRSIKPAPTGSKARREEKMENPSLPGHSPRSFVKDPVVQSSFGPLDMPTPISNFEGIPNRNGLEPPDANGDVGPNHYVQAVNTSLQIWDKSGNSVYGPVDLSTLWSGFGGICQTHDDGDPIVLYDPLADRWVISQLAIGDPDYLYPSHACIAVSQTADPTGSYYRYDFLTTPNGEDFFGDYPHLAVWSDGYYMTTNQFRVIIPGFFVEYAGAGNFAFERDRMLTGDPNAQVIYFGLGTQDGGMLPSDLDGTTPPPVGSPNYFIEPFDDAIGVLHEFRFHADWGTPANSTFTGPIAISVDPWNRFVCPDQNGLCIDQPNTSVKLAAISDRFMHRLAYRNRGDHESLVVNITANANNLAGIRWFELRDPNGAPFAFQQGTYSPSSDHRWMGSIAMDHVGNIALGYSVSNATDVYPSIRYTGRLVTDPPGIMGQGEGTLIAGGGSQPDQSRWGDYSAIAVDPVDDCTFWYTNEYYSTTPPFDDWQTRIGSFKFPSCVIGTPTTTPTGTPPTITPTFTPSNTPTPTPTQCGNYGITQSSGVPIVPGTALIAGSRGDEQLVNIPLPFGYSLYGQNYNNVYASSNGYLQFPPTGNNYYENTCLPSSLLNSAIVALWDDLCTGDCFFDPCNGCGIFTSVSGSTPARIFNIEWRACIWNYFTAECIDTANFEVRLHEGQGRFDMVYGTVVGGGNGATVGVQNGTGPQKTQFSCNSGVISSGLQLAFIQSPCATSTATPTRTITPTSTPTFTPTNTPVPAYLIGHVTWQGRPAQPDPLQELPITLTLKLGATEVNYPATTTGDGGHFVVSVTGLVSGTWSWRVKGPKYLAKAGTVRLVGAPTTISEMGLMLAGDCNNDEFVSIHDFIILKNTFGRANGDPGYDDRADFTGEQAVGVPDFNLLKSNFDLGSAPPIRPIGPRD